MATPALLVEIAFDSPPLEAHATTNGNPPTIPSKWTDVSAYVRGELHMHRGRNHETQDFEAGTLTLTLSNKDRRFDPTNTAGPYYGKLVPMRKIRVRAEWPAATFTPMFSGYIEAWRPVFGNGDTAVVHLECVDAFKIFNLYTIQNTGLLANQRSDARIGAALTAVGWATADRNLTAGVMRVAEVTGLVTNALAHMQAVTRTEGGLFYMARGGSATFRAQGERAAVVGPYVLFSDDPAGAANPYADLVIESDDTHIWNYISITREGGLEQVAQDATSITNFALRRLNLTGLLFEDDQKAANVADLYLRRYKDARVRAVSMTIDPAVRDVWAVVLALDFHSVISVQRSTLLGGTRYDADCHLEAIDWRITKGLWMMAVQLSPKQTATIGTATLQTGTRWLVPVAGLTAPWLNIGGVEANAGFRKDSAGWVTLRGVVYGGVIGGYIMTLPVGYRPTYNVRAAVAAGNQQAAVGVLPDGRVQLVNANPAWVAGTDFVDLAGVRFKVD